MFQIAVLEDVVPTGRKSVILDLSIMLANLGDAMSSLASLVTLGESAELSCGWNWASERLSSLSRIAQLGNMTGWRTAARF